MCAHIHMRRRGPLAFGRTLLFALGACDARQAADTPLAPLLITTAMMRPTQGPTWDSQHAFVPAADFVSEACLARADPKGHACKSLQPAKPSPLEERTINCRDAALLARSGLQQAWLSHRMTQEFHSHTFRESGR